MPKVKLTKTLIDSLEYSDKSVFYQDTQVNGLAVRVNAARDRLLAKYGRR